MNSIKKKALSVLLAACTALLVTSCGNNENSSSSANEAEPIVRSETSSEATESTAPAPKGIKVVSSLFDLMVYNDVEDLAEKADLIVTGEFIGEASQEIKYDDPENQKWFSFATSKGEFRIDKVLKGAPGSENVTIEQYYGIDTVDSELTLHAITGLSPMENGMKCICFLKKTADGESYSFMGDTQGRWPLPSEIGKADRYGFVNGVLDEKDFNRSWYDEIVKKYDLK